MLNNEKSLHSSIVKIKNVDKRENIKTGFTNKNLLYLYIFLNIMHFWLIIEMILNENIDLLTSNRDPLLIEPLLIIMGSILLRCLLIEVFSKENRISFFRDLFLLQILVSLLYFDFGLYWDIGGRFMENFISVFLDNLPPAFLNIALVAAIIHIFIVQRRRSKRSKMFFIPNRMIFANYSESIKALFMIFFSIAFYLLKIVFGFIIVINSAMTDSINEMELTQLQWEFQVIASTIGMIIILFYIIFSVAKPKIKRIDYGVKNKIINWLVEQKKDFIPWFLGISYLIIIVFVLIASMELNGFFIFVSVVFSIIYTYFYYILTKLYIETNYKEDFIINDSNVPSLINILKISDISYIVAFKHNKEKWILFPIVDSSRYENTIYTIDIKEFIISSIDNAIITTETAYIMIIKAKIDEQSKD